MKNETGTIVICLDEKTLNTVREMNITQELDRVQFTNTTIAGLESINDGQIQ